MIISLQKSQKMKNQTSPGHPNGLRNVDAKIEHRHRRRTGTLAKMQNMVLQVDEEEEKKTMGI
jgi:hypothetical protein